MSLAALVFVAVTGAVVAVGSIYSSAAQPNPLAGSVAGSAVVVSSLACTDSTGGTIVDVLPDGAPGVRVRADLDACGYQEGQQLQVRYVPGGAGQVVLAGNESDDDLAVGDRLLPIGLFFVGLLAIGAVLAVMMPAVARRLRPGRHARPDELPIGEDPADPAGVQLAAVDAPETCSAGFDSAGFDAALAAGPDPAGFDPAGFDPARESPAAFDPAGIWDWWPDAVDRATRRPADDNGQHGPLTAVAVISWSTANGADSGSLLPGMVDNYPIEPTEWSPSVVDLSFPYTGDLAASLHDELFTHRSRPS